MAWNLSKYFALGLSCDMFQWRLSFFLFTKCEQIRWFSIMINRICMQMTNGVNHHGMDVLWFHSYHSFLKWRHHLKWLFQMTSENFSTASFFGASYYQCLSIRDDETTTREKSLLITQAMSLNFSFEMVFFVCFFENGINFMNHFGIVLES